MKFPPVHHQQQILQQHSFPAMLLQPAETMNNNGEHKLNILNLLVTKWRWNRRKVKKYVLSWTYNRVLHQSKGKVNNSMYVFRHSNQHRNQSSWQNVHKALPGHGYFLSLFSPFSELLSSLWYHQTLSFFSTRNISICHSKGTTVEDPLLSK